MKISVIVPTYKTQSYIEDLLRSLSKQTIDKDFFETIIVLNGPKEPFNTFLNGVIKEYSSKINIRLIYSEKAGVSNARNLGIESSTGEYITFIDDDDYVSDNYLKALLDCALLNKCMPLSNLMAFNDGEKEFYPTYHTRCYTRNSGLEVKSIYQVREFFLTPCCKLLTKGQISNIRFNPEFKNSEDALFMFTISKNINKISFADQTAIYYRRVRPTSANFRPRTKSDIIKNEAAVLKQMLRVWSHEPFKYNFFYTVSKVLAFGKQVVSTLFR